ncbi:MAG TPA: PAS domain-containing sensor histidine kinase [Micavibrio sp.]|nr:PAS domain-containing sensor histidine kinase [Micavibrio sp.]
MPQHEGIDYDYRSRGFLSGGAAQLTVFCSGLVLTVLSYLLLNLVIGDVVQEDNEARVKRKKLEIERSVDALHNDVYIASSLLERADDLSLNNVQEYVRANVPNLENFDALYLLVKDGEDYSIDTVYQNDDAEQRLSDTPGSLEGLKSYFLKAIQAHKGSLKKNMLVMSDHPGNREWQEFVDPVSKGRNFLFMHESDRRDGLEVILIANLNIGKIFDAEWLRNNPNIERIVVQDANTKQRLYYMNRQYDGNEDVNLKASGFNFGLTVQGAVWYVNILPGKDPRMVFLDSMPNLMLFFGLLLTSEGTLYVRNNQKKAYQLASMNKALAQKNYELNSEVAERERLNQTLRKAEREYKAIVDAVSDIIFETSVDGNVIFLNGTWERVVGSSSSEVIGKDLFDMIHPEDRQAEREKFDMLVQGKKSAYRSMTRLLTKGSTYRSVELAISMIRQDENRNMRVVGTITDVEERRRAEKALREAEKKYRTIVENAAGGIYQMTPEGRYISANPAMARILGYDNPGELLREISNAHQQIYAAPDKRLAFISDIESAERLDSKEFEIVCKDGKRIWVNENARAVKDDEGNMLYVEGSLEDVTSRRKAEEDIRIAMANSEMANRAKTEFLANMSHELRTPLNAIIGFAEIIKDEVFGPLENKQYWEYAKDIHESGRGLLSIINEILDVARIEAGERHLNENVVVLSRLANSCVEFVAPKVEEKKLSFKNQMDSCHIEIMAEERAMKQILINLLSNAVKFTPEGGRITMECEAEVNKPVRISITDTGAGMESSDIEKALSPFGQIETAHSRSGSGAGLGLTLVNALVKLHGGSMEIFSQKGIGTTVTIQLPAKRYIGEVRGSAKERGEDDTIDQVVTESDDGDESSNPQIH